MDQITRDYLDYNLGKDIVRNWVERNNGDNELRWARFEQLILSPMTAANLRANDD